MTTTPFPPPLQLRAARPSDASSLAHFAAAIFADTFGHSVSAEQMQRFVSETYGVAQQAAEIADPCMVTRLLVDGDEIAGFYQLRWPESDAVLRVDGAEIARFYLSRSWHGRGIASPLMLAALEELRQGLAPRAWLGVWEENARAIAFYQKSGFRTVGRQSFELGGVRQSDLVMAQSLLRA